MLLPEGCCSWGWGQLRELFGEKTSLRRVVRKKHKWTWRGVLGFSLGSWCQWTENAGMGTDGQTGLTRGGRAPGTRLQTGLLAAGQAVTHVLSPGRSPPR